MVVVVAVDIVFVFARFAARVDFFPNADFALPEGVAEAFLTAEFTGFAIYVNEKIYMIIRRALMAILQ